MNEEKDRLSQNKHQDHHDPERHRGSDPDQQNRQAAMEQIGRIHFGDFLTEGLDLSQLVINRSVSSGLLIFSILDLLGGTSPLSSDLEKMSSVPLLS